MIDELEKKIVRVMNRNARKSFREIAKELGTSATAVVNKVKKLETSGVIRGYVPIIRPDYFGLDLTAVIALRITKGKLLETQQRISEDRRVVAVYDVTGEWDSFVIGRFRGSDDLNDFIKGVLSMPNVDRTVTHLVLNVVKEEKRVPV
jgi:Lrp/AsnC family transcriptional regulator for asnA, asnC and gidA